jgi:hypothetical protein
MTVVRFIANVPGWRYGNSSDHFSVASGILVKIDDRKKIRRHTCLISCPDVQSFGSVFLVVVTIGAIMRKGGSGKKQN